MSMKKLEWTNPLTNEKFIIKDKVDGTHHLLYGPKDGMGQKNHGHAVFDARRNLIMNRNPRIK